MKNDDLLFLNPDERKDERKICVERIAILFDKAIQIGSMEETSSISKGLKTAALENIADAVEIFTNRLRTIDDLDSVDGKGLSISFASGRRIGTRQL